MAELYGKRIESTVREKYLPFVVDTTLNGNVFFQRIVRASKQWSGRKLRVPIKVSKNSTGQSYRGFDTFSTSATDNRQIMEFTNSNYQITCALPGDGLAIANTEDAVLDLMKLTIQSDTEDMADDLGTMFYGDGTGGGGDDFLGLGALVDDGSSVDVYGGLSRTTYTTLQSTVTASGGTMTLAQVDTLWDNVTSGTQKPTVGITTEAVFSLYGQLLRPQERINKTAGRMKGMVGSTGFTGLDYKGIAIIADEKCTSGSLYLLNENYIDFYALPSANAEAVQYKSQMEGNDYNSPMGLGFAWSGWIVPSNAEAVIGHIYFKGQLVGTNPKRQGVLTGVTAI